MKRKIRRVNKEDVQQAALDSLAPAGSKLNLLADAQGQTCLIFSLATELLLEIISYFPKVPERAWVSPYDPFLSYNYCQRPDVLRALSQTCRALRKFFTPWYWEYLDVCTNRFNGAWHLHISATLEARSIGLSRRPDLAVHVRVVNVVLTRCSTDTVLPEFAQCLSQLPNLHTLQVVHAHSQMTTVLGKYFKDIKLPSVRLAILPAHAHNILRCCTEVRTVVCTEGESSKLVSAIRSSCPNVEVVRGFQFNVVQMKALIRAAPNLRCIELPETVSWRLAKSTDDVAVKVMEMLSSFTNLSTIEILCQGGKPSEAHVDAARKVLLKRSTEEKKTLKVVTRTAPDHRSSNFRVLRERPATMEEVVEFIDLSAPTVNASRSV